MCGGTYCAFGIHFRAGFDLPLMSAGYGSPTLTVRLERPSILNLCWSGPAGAPIWSTTFDDGREFVAEQGVAGDYRFSYGAAATFLLSSDRTSLTCAPNAGPSADWLRVLLDSVLFSVALLRGYEALHASAVETDRGVFGFLGPSGAGKSSLALEFLARGGRLFCDDILVFEPEHRAALVQPGPPLMNLPSDRAGIGIKLATFPTEVWTRVDAVSTAPQPLSALFSLHPSATGAISISRSDVWELVPHSLSLPDTTDRARTRFTLLCDIAEMVPLFRVEVPAASASRDTADAVEWTLDRLGMPEAQAA